MELVDQCFSFAILGGLYPGTSPFHVLSLAMELQNQYSWEDWVGDIRGKYHLSISLPLSPYPFPPDVMWILRQWLLWQKGYKPLIWKMGFSLFLHHLVFFLSFNLTHWLFCLSAQINQCQSDLEIKVNFPEERDKNAASIKGDVHRKWGKLNIFLMHCFELYWVPCAYHSF